MSRVVRCPKYGNADILRIEDVQVPASQADEIQTFVRAIGFNRAEVMFLNGA